MRRPSAWPFVWMPIAFLSQVNRSPLFKENLHLRTDSYLGIGAKATYPPLVALTHSLPAKTRKGFCVMIFSEHCKRLHTSVLIQHDQSHHPCPTYQWKCPLSSLVAFYGKCASFSPVINSSQGLDHSRASSFHRSDAMNCQGSWCFSPIGTAQCVC